MQGVRYSWENSQGSFESYLVFLFKECKTCMSKTHAREVMMGFKPSYSHNGVHVVLDYLHREIVFQDASHVWGPEDAFQA